MTASWQYDAYNQLLQVCNATPTNTISQYDYTCDAAGRRIACGKSGSASAQDETIAYGYNNRSELTNAVAAVDSDYRYAYDFDDIGNRESSSECGTNHTYTANNLNQYTLVGRVVPNAPQEEFIPQFDDDGNQTLVKTATGIWQIQYNGENRPIRWECVSPNSSTPTLISMSYDRMGRRVTKNNQRFVYDGYLQIANFEHQTSNIKLQTFIWDPAEPVATRPLAWNSSTFQPFNSSTSYYTHDGNKNVSEVITVDGSLAAHYEYAPFGAVTAQCGTSVADNPWRFSSEYAEDDTATVYYNYRHYEPVMGRWMSRDPIGGKIEIMIYGYLRNRPTDKRDFIGLFDDGGYVCLEKQGVYEYVPSVGFVYKEVCVAWEYKKGHKDFPNNGTNCPFDYTAEDNSIWTSPFTPWGLWRHFRSMEDVISDIFDLLEKPRCDAKRFQSLMHQLQDFFTHYNRSGEVFSCEIKWRWWH